MMDREAFDELRGISDGLFDNGHVLPVALAALCIVTEGGSFKLAELREELGGRAADNPIRAALRRIEASGAVRQLTSMGPPYPDAWERQPHPFWQFIDIWAGQLAETGKEDPSS